MPQAKNARTTESCPTKNDAFNFCKGEMTSCKPATRNAFLRASCSVFGVAACPNNGKISFAILRVSCVLVNGDNVHFVLTQ